MLTMTEHATAVIGGIVAQAGDQPEAGLRIHSEEQGEFGVAVVPAAEPGDMTVEQGGARVHLDPGASIALDQKVLDASADDEGRVQFAIGDQ